LSAVGFVASDQLLGEAEEIHSPMIIMGNVSVEDSEASDTSQHGAAAATTETAQTRYSSTTPSGHRV
jgi:hypothetical protein